MISSVSARRKCSRRTFMTVCGAGVLSTDSFAHAAVNSDGENDKTAMKSDRTSKAKQRRLFISTPCLIGSVAASGRASALAWTIIRCGQWLEGRSALPCRKFLLDMRNCIAEEHWEISETRLGSWTNQLTKTLLYTAGCVRVVNPHSLQWHVTDYSECI